MVAFGTDRSRKFRFIVRPPGFDGESWTGDAGRSNVLCNITRWVFIAFGIV